MLPAENRYLCYTHINAEIWCLYRSNAGRHCMIFWWNNMYFLPLRLFMSGLKSRLYIFIHFWIPIALGKEFLIIVDGWKCLLNGTVILEIARLWLRSKSKKLCTGGGQVQHLVLRAGWPTLLVCLELGGCPGHRTCMGATTKVTGLGTRKPEFEFWFYHLINWVTQSCMCKT